MELLQTSAQENVQVSLTRQLKQVSDALINFSPTQAQAEQLRSQLVELLSQLDTAPLK